MEEKKEISQKKGTRISRDEILFLLSEEPLDSLIERAYAVKVAEIGKRVSLRALIEWSSVCSKNCYYCGIRRGNSALARYRMSEDEIVSLALKAHKDGYGNLVLQSGEIESDENTSFVERVLKRIAASLGDDFGVTLSLGEQTDEVFERWREAGAHRYLLRIETSNRELYSKIHPQECSWERRRNCLRSLRKCGYQVGTGVMCALPGQTIEDLADDIIFFAEEDIDMIGMGPYIPHPATPLGQGEVLDEAAKRERFDLALRMIAVARIALGDVNIASTTALQALDPQGREKGILAGANVIMPNVTDSKYNESYNLYADKPRSDSACGEDVEKLSRLVESIGEKLLVGERGDSPHYKARGGDLV